MQCNPENIALAYIKKDIAASVLHVTFSWEQVFNSAICKQKKADTTNASWTISQLPRACDLHTALATEGWSSASISTSVLWFQLTSHVCHLWFVWLLDWQAELTVFRGVSFSLFSFQSVTGLLVRQIPNILQWDNQNTKTNKRKGGDCSSDFQFWWQYGILFFNKTR